MDSKRLDQVSRYVSINDIGDWQSDIARFVMRMNEPFLQQERVVCNKCPFRNKPLSGGCIGKDCPIYALRSEFNKTTKRAMARVKEIMKQIGAK